MLYRILLVNYTGAILDYKAQLVHLLYLTLSGTGTQVTIGIMVTEMPTLMHLVHLLYINLLITYSLLHLQLELKLVLSNYLALHLTLTAKEVG